MSANQLDQFFADPPVKYRAISFWALNGDLKAGELCRQIDSFSGMGFGAVCLHARSGLQTRYLSPQWFRLMRRCVEHAKECNMLVWLYDEDRYPSGAAGGIVTKNPKYRQKRLRFDPLPRNGKIDAKNVVAWFAMRRQGKQTAFRRIARPRECDRGESLVAFRLLTAPLNPWYNGYTYLDAADSASVRKFIESTYAPYQRELGEHFGKTIEAIFTDEPTYGQAMIGWWGDILDGYKDAELREVPWSTTLRSEFQDHFGYDLLDHLPELFLDCNGNTASTRHNYYDLLTRKLTDSFAKQIYQWCDDAGVKFAGHVLCEETCSSQTAVVGSAMRFYEHFHIPGIDILTDALPEYDTAIQCASIARQTGTSDVLTETFGATGWNFPIEGHKAVGDWQAALGVTRRCLHLAFYTMLGAAKRDYPASIGFQSAWAKHYKPVEDYFARLSAVLSCGKARCPVLVIHPVESTWLRWRMGARQAADIKRMDRNLIALRDALLAAQIGFDYGDEQLLQKWASVAQDDAEPAFRVNQSSYRAVIVPPMLTMRSTTCDLLERYADAGGRVVFVGKPAGMVDVQASDRVRALADRCERIEMKDAAIASAVSDLGSVAISPKRSSKQILSQARDDDDRTILFLCNTSRSKSLKGVEITLQASGVVREWDSTSARRFHVPSTRVPRGLSFRADLPASGSALFVIDSQSDESLAPKPQWRDVRKTRLSAKGWTCALDEPNPMVLDFVRVRIGRGKWSKAMEVLQADRHLRLRFGWKPHSYFEVQPWKQPSSNGELHRVQVKSNFEIDTMPGGTIELAMEQMFGVKQVRINSHVIDLKTDSGWWIDPCFRKYSIHTDWLRVGSNEVEYDIDYTQRSGLESCYLLSEGAVYAKPNGSVLSRSRPFTIGDITREGMPFYGGAIRYSRTISITPTPGRSTFLSLPGFCGACAVVYLDGIQIAGLYWPPYEVRLPIDDDRLHELTIEIVLGRGNTFGPLHQRGKRSVWTGPREWETTGAQWQDAYRLWPSGLIKPPVLIDRQPLERETKP